MMDYPNDFRAALRETFPTWTRLHDAADRGSELVGRYLDDSQGRVSTKEILAATSLDELLVKARFYERVGQLYAEWLVMYRKQSLLE